MEPADRKIRSPLPMTQPMLTVPDIDCIARMTPLELWQSAFFWEKREALQDAARHWLQALETRRLLDPARAHLPGEGMEFAHRAFPDESAPPAPGGLWNAQDCFSPPAPGEVDESCCPFCGTDTFEHGDGCPEGPSPDSAKRIDPFWHCPNCDCFFDKDGVIPSPKHPSPDNAKLVERLRDERHCNDRYLRNEAAAALEALRKDLKKSAAACLEAATARDKNWAKYEAAQAHIKELEQDIARYAYSSREKEVTAAHARIKELEQEVEREQRMRDHFEGTADRWLNRCAEIEQDRDNWRAKAGG